MYEALGARLGSPRIAGMDDTRVGKAWFQRIRTNGHDAFGIAQSPETLRILAEVARDRFHAGANEELDRWVVFTVAVATCAWLEPDDVQWLRAQRDALTQLPASDLVRAALAQFPGSVVG